MARSPAVRCAMRARASCHRALSSTTAKLTHVQLTFIDQGEEIAVRARLGKTILEISQDNNIELEGACDGTLACSTCHCVLMQSVYDALDPPEEDELDMLDMAYELTDTSRLGCQVRVTEEFTGTRITVPHNKWPSAT